MKIINYMVANDETINGLEQIVNEMIKSGWEPIGGINGNVASAMQRPDYRQAMIKKESDEDIAKVNKPHIQPLPYVKKR